MSEQELDDPSNLLLLCGNHHKLVDDQPRTHTVEVLRRFKADHERWVREKLGREVDTLAHTPEVPAQDAGDVVPADLGEVEEELIRMRRRVVTEPGDADAWQSLARAQYRLRLYPEALESLERARAAGCVGDRLDQLRASILTDSVRPGTSSEKAGLLEAREIFARLAIGSDEWVHHYDLGNVLKALEDNEGAAQAYEEAIRLDEEHPEIWINLATVQHRLGRHSEELDSFNRALELNPDKPEALAGKGSTLLVDHKDGPAAAELLERAIEVAPERWSDWPYIWFWLAKAHSIAGETGRALNVANEGIRRAPSNKHLLSLKADLLSKLARDDDSYASEAISYYRFLIKLSPYDYGRRGELLALLERVGDETGGWALLEEIFPQVGLELERAHLRDLGVSLHACYHGLRLLPDYATYRLRNPVEKYWDAENELMLGFSQLPRRAPRAASLLTAAGAVAFGVYFEALIGKGPEYPDLDALLESYRQSAAILLRACPVFTIAILKNEYADGTTEGRLPIIELPAFVGDTLLGEISSLSGWIAARLGVSETLRMQTTESDEVTEFHRLAINVTWETTLRVAKSE